MKPIHLITLMETPNVRRKTIFKVLEVMDSAPENLNDLLDLLKLAKERKGRIHVPQIDDLRIAERSAIQILSRTESLGIHVTIVGDRLFPKKLRNIPDPPVILYSKGDLESNLNQQSVAVIGTREPTEYGKRVAYRFGELFALKDLTVVSGLAIGCDTQAHRGSLSKSGKTIAVLANGLDEVSPKSNTELAQEIVHNGGCLISEYPPGAFIHPGFFVERDRLQSGLSDAVVVVETDVQGGTMNTVRSCIEQKRILACFMHPENKRSDKSRGNDLLIREMNARPLHDNKDIEMLIDSIVSNTEIYRMENDSVPRETQLTIEEVPHGKTEWLVIFDLDQTLIDSSVAKDDRDSRRWSQVYRSIPLMKSYKGIDDLLKALKNKKVKTGLVTSSPRPYCERVVEYQNWSFDVIVCYHDTKEHKPHPAPIQQALQSLNHPAERAICIGDRMEDIIASKTAGCISIAALWDSIEDNPDMRNIPDAVLDNSEDLSAALFKWIK